MTWEETIRCIRSDPGYRDLVKFAYFEEDLALNVERFRDGSEYRETKRLLSAFFPHTPSLRILDIGSGNGISAVSFAIDGHQVDAVEPDPSETIGSGAISWLKEHYRLENLQVHSGYAEDLKFPAGTFDVVYARQCMHHAHNLKQFILESARVLRKGGLLFTVRDHVIYDEADKKWFLDNHPLQRFYGGENAFTLEQYRSGMEQAGLKIQRMYGHYENVINYFPLSIFDLEEMEKRHNALADGIVSKKLGILRVISPLRKMAAGYVKKKLGPALNEARVPGRLYTFLATKN
jgi:SAM-dependent methyltransferase